MGILIQGEETLLMRIWLKIVCLYLGIDSVDDIEKFAEKASQRAVNSKFGFAEFVFFFFFLGLDVPWSQMLSQGQPALTNVTEWKAAIWTLWSLEEIHTLHYVRWQSLVSPLKSLL